MYFDWSMKLTQKKIFNKDLNFFGRLLKVFPFMATSFGILPKIMVEG